MRVGRYTMDCAAMDIGLGKMSGEMTNPSRKKVAYIRDHRKR